jgi:hypothetical protein
LIKRGTLNICNMLDENIENIPAEETENIPTPKKTQEVTDSDDQPTLENTDKVSKEQEAVAEIIENKESEETDNMSTSEKTKEVTDSDDQPMLENTEKVSKEQEAVAEVIENKESEGTDNIPTSEKTKEVTESDDQPTLENTVKVSEKQETVAEVIENKENEELNSSDITEKAKEDADKVEAKTSEKEIEVAPIVEKQPKETSKLEDYSVLSLEELVSSLQKLIKKGEINRIKNDVETIKNNFNKKFGELLSEKKKAFLEEGGNEIDFHYNNSLKSQYNDLLFEYKIKRDKNYKQQKEEQNENLIQRLALIDDLKSLIDNAEASTMYKHFRELQDKWRTIGKIPHANYNDVWRTYHHHVERFYDLLHLNNDFRDLDFKHNLDEKLKLVERAEILAEEIDVNKAFKELQILHRLWKEDIGPIAKEFREDVWNKFSAATKKVHDRRHDFQKELESKYEANVALKEEVIEAIRNLVGEEPIDSHNIWQQKIKELEALRQKFFKLGRVPRAKNELIWTSFKEATANFNRKKNVFYKSIKKHQQDNLDKKRALVEKAESFKDNDDWVVTTPIMKEIQAEWKTIGHVPRKFSDEIWKRFKNACNHYFDKLHSIQDEANKDQIEIFNKKKEMLESLRSQAEDNEVLSLEVIQAYINDWRALGNVPFNMRHIESKFNKVVDKLYEKLDLDKNAIAMLRFKNIVNGYIEQKQYRKIDDEQLFLRKKVDEINKEIQQLENNIGFFSSTTDDNPLLKNVRDNIDKYNDDLVIWKEKLSYLSKLDY